MSLKHLAAGSSCPPLSPGVLRCYNMKYCPFAQRTLLVLNAKNIPHEVVNINLKKKPDWFLNKAPLAKVPTLEKDGKIIYESLTTCNYLNEIHPEPPLYPVDPWQKATDCNFMEIMELMVINKVHKMYYNLNDKTLVAALGNEVRTGLDLIEKELSSRSSKFFGGDRPGMLDYAIWPWFERAPVTRHFVQDETIIPEERYPELMLWTNNMKTDPAVMSVFISKEEHIEFMNHHMAGEPIYDFDIPKAKC